MTVKPFFQKTLPPLVLLALLTGASLLLIGYRFAVWDQLLYLSFVDRYFQPILDHPGDLYIHHFLWRSYTTFWLLVYPLKQAFGWEWPLFLIYLTAKFFLFWGLWSLTFTLTKNRLAAWLTVLFMLLNKAVIGGGVNFYMADTITRYVVLPFLLFGVKYLWERKWLGAALLLGLAVQIHLLSTVYWLLAVAITGAAYRLFADAGPVKISDIRRLIAPAGLFLLCALPILIWAAVGEWGKSQSLPDAELRNFIRHQHQYVFFSNYNSTTWKTLLLFVLLILAAVRSVPAGWYAPFTIGIVTVLGGHFLVADVFFYLPLLKFQMIRIVDLLGLWAMIGAAQILAVNVERGGRPRWLAGLIAGLFLIATVAPGTNNSLFAVAAFLVLLLAFEPRPGSFTIPALLLVVLYLWAQLHYPATFGRRGALWTPALVIYTAGAAGLFLGWFATHSKHWYGVFAGCYLGLILMVIGVETNATPQSPKRTGYDWPGQGMESDWIQFQLWVRDNTPPGTMFFVPPGLNGFRVFSQRNAFYELYDCEPAIFQPDYARALLERLKVFDNSPAANRKFALNANGYYAQTPAQWRELAQQWDVSYLITDRRVNLPFEKLHVRGPLTLWQIPR
ncbi:MAG: hypothetical protein PCFJNLEI_02690 [Verrucomicrobiae bacterium]|nr:hypothetical protein [Verrucomicrobiae bacterium]